MSKVLPRLPIHITFFSRSSCALCTNARQNLADAWKLRPFEFAEIDVMEPGQQKWKDVYEFDVPVIHVSKTGKGGVVEEVKKKLMHRFTPEEIVKAWDEVREQGPVNEEK
ncbi:uncharacterized protein H6S33_003309 [Morchella sextelata]|uniref:uncharacterized protein n=1 Tax=Morchella sextelata TaxID=1174677 RepID=UPI001D04D532|nr:uncharacterized protein H6S33_003309 [Morchella sextelata]KAH0607321.1 hypothetical protein H6S33_003309 [Morchella sextelata]